MAEVARMTGPSLASLLPDSSQKITGLVAGEDLLIGDACYIKGADGKVWKSNGTAATEAAHVDGWVLVNVSAGEAVTLVHNINVQYSNSLLVPGTRYFVSATVPGGIATVATTGGVTSVAFAVDTKRIHCMLSRY